MAYRNVSVWLEDILMTISKLNEITSTINTADEYEANTLTKLATERGLEIVAEAVRNAIKLNPELPISDYRKIINLRNLINHEYYEINHSKLWIILKQNIPVLEKELKQILEDYERRLELNEL